MTNNLPTIVQTVAQLSIPFQQIADWFFGIAVPVLFGLWRKHAKNTKVLDSLISGIELAGKNLSKDQEQVLKRTVKNTALDDGTQTDLHAKVRELTGHTNS